MQTIKHGGGSRMVCAHFKQTPSLGHSPRPSKLNTEVVHQKHKFIFLNSRLDL